MSRNRPKNSACIARSETRHKTIELGVVFVEPEWQIGTFAEGDICRGFLQKISRLWAESDVVPAGFLQFIMNKEFTGFLRNAFVWEPKLLIDV